MVSAGSEQFGNSDSILPMRVDLSFWQLWNISFGFFGIQVGWGLQMANTSAIFESLGADATQLPLLWLAAPMSGLVIQPLVGYLSDRTRHSLGRRRPYFLIGALFSSLALLLMPNAPTLWIAAGLLWLLDASANISMTPFRSFISDLVPEHQHTQAFSMQGVMMGGGAVIASALPWLIAHFLPVATYQGLIPFSVKLSFYIGAVAFSGAVLWTMMSASKPFIAQTVQIQESSSNPLSEILQAVRDMPDVMRQLAWVQCFSWLGMFCVFLYFPPAIAHSIFNATKGTPLYAAGIEWAGLCMAMYNLVCCGFSFLLPALSRRLTAQVTHCLCLLCGAIGLSSLGFIHDQYLLILPMMALGIAFSSMLSLPYAMLMPSLPPKQNCLYMGLFNCFIVLPEIVAALGLGWVMGAFLGGDRLSAVILGGGFMAIGAICTLFVQQPETSVSASKIEAQG